jgi:hypothetical protein
MGLIGLCFPTAVHSAWGICASNKNGRTRKAPNTIADTGLFNGLEENTLLDKHHIQLQDRNQDKVADATSGTHLNPDLYRI